MQANEGRNGSTHLLLMRIPYLLMHLGVRLPAFPAGYMLPHGAVKLSAGDAPLASGKEASHFAADDQEPCAGG